MKIIQNRELERIQMMIVGDKEMRDLAKTILEKKEVFRFSFLTIVIFHYTLFVGILTLLVWLAYHFSLGLYLVPMIAAATGQLVASIAYLSLIEEFRKRYNHEMRR